MSGRQSVVHVNRGIGLSVAIRVHVDGVNLPVSGRIGIHRAALLTAGCLLTGAIILRHADNPDDAHHAGDQREGNDSPANNHQKNMHDAGRGVKQQRQK